MISLFRRLPKHDDVVLKHSYDEGFLNFILEKSGVAIPVSEWPINSHNGANSILEHASQTNPEGVKTNTVTITEYDLMDWMEGQEQYIQKLLNLPAIYDGGIQIDSQGTFHQPDFKISYYWQQMPGRKYASSREEGCFLYVAGEKKILSFHAWKLKNALTQVIDRLNATSSTTERMLQWHEIQQLIDILPDEEKERIKKTSVLGSIRLFYANALRIDAIPNADGYDIVPVLLRQRPKDSDTEDSNPEHEALLTPAEQEKYAASFAIANSVAECTSLEVGRYVIINNDVRRILQHIQTVRKQSPEDRLKFLKNPRSALMLIFEDDIDEETFTAILSDRVVGIGTWQAKVIPYVQMKGQEWVPDSNLPKGIIVTIPETGEHSSIPVADENESEKLTKAIQEAINAGKPTINWKGQNIPATPQTISAVKTLFPARPKDKDSESKEAPREPAENDRNVVIVKDNLGDVTYHVIRKPRLRVPENGFPEQIRTEPKPHQRTGFDWLCRHYQVGSRGVLLADDMGLGKTWQALAFLAWLRQGMIERRIQDSPLLIIAPTGLLRNWESEIKDHLKDGLGDIVPAYGTFLKTYRRGGKDSYYLDTARLQEADLVLTTYETLNNYQTSFTAINFSAVVFDEMQKVKNPASQITNAVNGIKADFWLGMTGTPVENRLADIWCITDILQPGWLGSIKQFSQKFEKPLTQNPPSYTALEELKAIITEPSNDGSPEYMLRRMKKNTLVGLPQKREHVFSEIMPPAQALEYSNIIETARNSDDPGAMLQALQRMRAVSLHPDYRRQKSYANDQSFIEDSARLKKCFDILEDIKNKREKALIFIEYDLWHQSDFLPALLKRKFNLPELPMVINGSVKGQDRQKRVERFQEERDVFDVMLISPKAGGVGLTLTAANHVIHLTRWWNPAVEDQATDRVYRIGQKREVHVYYPMAVHPEFQSTSFDVCLNNLLDKKRRLSQDVLLPILDNECDQQELFRKTVRPKDNDLVNISEMSQFTPKQFEAYVISQLQKSASIYNWIARSTPNSWDGGADVIIETTAGEILAVIQCKHSSNPEATTTGSDDIRRALQTYRLKNGICALITNAKVSLADTRWKNEDPKRNIILQGKDALSPESIISKIACNQKTIS